MSNIIKTIDKISNNLADIVDNLYVQSFIRKTLDLIIDTSIRVGVLVLLLSFGLNVGPAVESRFLGVFDEWYAENYVKNGDNWIFDVSASNPWYRFNCLYVSEQTVAANVISVDETNTTYTTHGVINILKSDIKMGSSRNLYSGKWELITDTPVPPNSLITGVLHHQCHVLWTTTTVFGPFNIRIN